MLLLVVLLAALSASKEVVHDQFIVSLRSPPTAALVLSLSNNVTVLRTWSFGTFAALLVQTSSRLALDHMALLPQVAHIESNAVVRINQQCKTEDDATWGINRINQVSPQLDGMFRFTPDEAGAGVVVYVVDTGIRLDHIEFGGRAVWGTNTIDKIDSDQNGHGTHAAGTAGGSMYGIAKRCTLVAVKVLDAQGSGTYASIIDGLAWVVGYNNGKKAKGVINMSLGGGKNQALNNATDAASRAGILVRR
jgi:subtilisin family serine protease